MGLRRREGLTRWRVVGRIWYCPRSQHQGDQLSAANGAGQKCPRACADPQFILLDEPFAGIDPKAIDDIQNVILICAIAGLEFWVRTTMSEKLGVVTDRAYIMADGRILVSGIPRDLTEDAEVRRLYLGDKFRM